MLTFIDETMTSKNLFELADNLESLIAYSLKCKAGNNLFSTLHNNLATIALEYELYNQNPYYIIVGAEAVNIYLLHEWNYSKSYKKNIKYLESLIEIIRTEFLQPQEEIMTEESIKTMMDLLNNRFGFFNKIIKNKSIKILLLNHSHISRNGFYATKRSENQPIKEMIVLLHKQYGDDRINECVLLHEFGHLLQTRITNAVERPPISFKKTIQEKMFFAKGPLDNKKLSELFAESFMMASLLNTSFSDNNPYDIVSNDDKETLSLYMRALIEVYHTDKGNPGLKPVDECCN